MSIEVIIGQEQAKRRSGIQEQMGKHLSNELNKDSYIPMVDSPPQEATTERKGVPVFSGVIKYFPDAIWEVAKCSKVGNDQHNAGEPLHWAREKSSDDPDALLRHLIEYDKIDDDGMLHATKVAWRALALLQKTLEARGEAPLSQHGDR